MSREQNAVVDIDGNAVQNLNAVAVDPDQHALIRANNNDDVHDVAADANDENTLHQREELIRKYKERYLLHVRVCLKFLEYNDPALYHQVFFIVHDCSRRHNRNNEPGYEDFALSIRHKLCKTIPDVYWSAIEDKVRKLEQQQRRPLQRQQQLLLRELAQQRHQVLQQEREQREQQRQQHRQRQLLRQQLEQQEQQRRQLLR